MSALYNVLVLLLDVIIVWFACAVDSVTPKHLLHLTLAATDAQSPVGLLL